MKVDQIVTRNKNDMNFSKKDTQTNWIFTTYTAGCFTKKMPATNSWNNFDKGGVFFKL